MSNARSESLDRIAKLEARMAYSFRNPASQRRRRVGGGPNGGTDLPGRGELAGDAASQRVHAHGARARLAVEAGQAVPVQQQEHLAAAGGVPRWRP